MSGLRNRNLLVVMDDGEHGAAGEYEVQLRLGDQTRAELEARKMGLKATENPIHLQALFGWACMVRHGHYSGPVKSFLADCIAVEDVKDDGEQVDPTGASQSSDSRST